MAFREVLAAVEEAKSSLVAAAPVGRGAGIPLADALLGFESALHLAAERMPGWRVPSVGPEWEASRAALDEAARRAQDFRLRPAPPAYEQLYGALADLLDPLDAFARARQRFRELGL
jgi:hypothetical protein